MNFDEGDKANAWRYVKEVGVEMFAELCTGYSKLLQAEHQN